VIGIDIIEISRIKNAIEQHGSRFLNKIFTSAEIAYCNSHKNCYEKFAARFAVKEAVAKVLKVDNSNFFRDIEISNAINGAPQAILSAQLRTKYALTDQSAQLEISMSHCKEYAVGIAIQKF
jgi:holo-[acyl-carrier protein] synthase